MFCSVLVECCDTMCVAPGHELGVHIAKAVLESRVTRERITNDRELPRCWMK
jgi:hypothetical protein